MVEWKVWSLKTELDLASLLTHITKKLYYRIMQTLNSYTKSACINKSIQLPLHGDKIRHWASATSLQCVLVETVETAIIRQQNC